MMLTKTKNYKVNSKKIIICLLVILGLVLMSLVILEKMNFINLFYSASDKSTQQKKQDAMDTKIKKDFIENEKKSEIPTATTHTSDDISVNARMEADKSVTILTQLKNYSDGVCDLTIENNEIIVKQSAPVIFQSTYSTCAGFNIETEKLGFGVWKISLKVTSKDKANTKDILFEVS